MSGRPRSGPRGWICRGNRHTHGYFLAFFFLLLCLPFYWPSPIPLHLTWSCKIYISLSEWWRARELSRWERRRPGLTPSSTPTVKVGHWLCKSNIWLFSDLSFIVRTQLSGGRLRMSSLESVPELKLPCHWIVQYFGQANGYKLLSMVITLRLLAVVKNLGMLHGEPEGKAMLMELLRTLLS